MHVQPWKIPAWTGLVVCALAFGALRLAKARSFQLFGEIIAQVPLSDPYVALTFDDGPEPAPARELLGVLSAHGVAATFFLEGSRVQQHPDLAKQIAAAGHELGNHSYSHQRMIFKSPAFVAEEIESTDRLLRSVGARDPILFRPPYGKKLFVLPWYLAQHGRLTVTWNIEPESYTRVAPNSRAIVDHIAQQARPGSIVLLHVMSSEREPSLRAVGPTIERLRAKGYHFETVSGLLARGHTRQATQAAAERPLR